MPATLHVRNRRQPVRNRDPSDSAPPAAPTTRKRWPPALPAPAHPLASHRAFRHVPLHEIGTAWDSQRKSDNSHQRGQHPAGHLAIVAATHHSVPILSGASTTTVVPHQSRPLPSPDRRSEVRSLISHCASSPMFQQHARCRIGSRGLEIEPATGPDYRHILAVLARRPLAEQSTPHRALKSALSTSTRCAAANAAPRCEWFPIE